MYKMFHVILAIVSFLISPVYIIISYGDAHYINSSPAIALTLLAMLNLFILNIEYDDKPLLQHIVSALVLMASTIMLVSVLINSYILFFVSLSFVGGALVTHLIAIWFVCLDTQSSFDTDSREQGVVKWFNVTKGFGFIIRDSGDDVFVHFNSIQTKGKKILKEGDRVEFSLAGHNKGVQAIDVVVLAKTD